MKPCSTKEEAVTGEEPMAVEETVTGEEDPLKPCPTKRKAKEVPVAGPLEHCAAKRMGGQAPAGCEEKAVFLAEVEAGTGSAFDLFGVHAKAAAIDRMLEQAKMPAAAVTGGEKGADGGNGKHRLSDDYVRLILALKREPDNIDYEDISYLRTNNPTTLPGCSPEWVEKTRQRYQEDAALAERIWDDFEPFQAQIRDEWLKKGYVEVDDEYLERTARSEEWTKKEWAKIDFTGIEIAGPDDEDLAACTVRYDPRKEFGASKKSED